MTADPIPELPPHYAVRPSPDNEVAWSVEHAYIDIGHWFDDLATRDAAVDAAWNDFRECCPEWWEAIERLREQVAFYRGCAEAAAEQECTG